MSDVLNYVLDAANVRVANTPAFSGLPLRKLDSGEYVVKGDPTTAGGGSVTATPPRVESIFVFLGNSGTYSIPDGAIGWTVLFSGSGNPTIGGVIFPTPGGDSDPNIVSGSIPLATDATTTAYIRYGVPA